MRSTVASCHPWSTLPCKLTCRPPASHSPGVQRSTSPHQRLNRHLSTRLREVPAGQSRRVNSRASSSEVLTAMGPLEVLPWVAAAASVWLVIRIVQFARSSVDGNLHRKGLAPAGAFAGKVVWITGASQGLGAELAAAFAERGARLVLSARRRDALQEVAEGCRQPGGPAHAVVPFDLLGDEAEVTAAATAAAAAFDGAGVDFLVHNAGCSQHSAAEETSVEVARRMLELNTLAPIALTRAALPAMLQRRKGRLVVISSMAALVPSPGQALYSCAKSGLNGYFQALATEVCDRGVAVTIVCPGPIATGSADKPRSVMGASGMVTTQTDTSAASKRLDPKCTAAWIVAAAHHGVREARIARQPILLLSYVQQYLPGVAAKILHRVGPRRVAAMKAGGSGYDVGGLLRSTDKNPTS